MDGRVSVWVACVVCRKEDRDRVELRFTFIQLSILSSHFDATSHVQVIER